jgi:hypothetical protein
VHAEKQADGVGERGRAGAMIRIGPAGWSYKDPEGIVYPQNPPKGFHGATYLAQFFDTIEVKSSFYRPPMASTAVAGSSGSPVIPDSSSRQSSGAGLPTSAMRRRRTRTSSSRAWMPGGCRPAGSAAAPVPVVVQVHAGEPSIYP